MNIDLQHSLDELARTVADDGTADRMSGQVRHMVGRVRRRRAARYAATGVASAAGATALALGGLELARSAPDPSLPAGPPVSTPPTPRATAERSPQSSPEPTPQPSPVEPVPVDPAVAALGALTAGTPTGVFPACGSATPADTGAAPLTLDLTLAPDGWTAGQRVEQTVSVRTTEGRHVLANADAAGARLVLARDGVVVGTVAREAQDATMLDLGPDRTQAVPLTGAFEVCEVAPTGDDAALGLPPGTYDAYAVLDVALKEVVEASGEAVSTSEPLVVRGGPVPVTVG